MSIEDIITKTLFEKGKEKFSIELHNTIPNFLSEQYKI